MFLSGKSQRILKRDAFGNYVETVLLEFRLNFLMDVVLLIFQVIPELKKNIKKGEDFVLGKWFRFNRCLKLRREFLVFRHSLPIYQICIALLQSAERMCKVWSKKGSIKRVFISAMPSVQTAVSNDIKRILGQFRLQATLTLQTLAIAHTRIWKIAKRFLYSKSPPRSGQLKRDLSVVRAAERGRKSALFLCPLSTAPSSPLGNLVDGRRGRGEGVSSEHEHFYCC